MVHGIIYMIGGYVKPNQALYWLRTQFPTILDEKKHIRFNSLYQENEPVDAFYRTVKRAGKLLKLTDDLIIDQFFRGLSADNIFEAESDVTQPPLEKQEPVVLTSKSSEVTQEQLQELLKAQAEELTKNFQQIKPVRPKPQRR
ncbi:hypothetical protein GLOIN_2v1790588 [Rhizophagus irregularis DAOM 181602=DAOM 197198]|nr:hypothetical protein GLOIN_2v1790588 [Rhizophagus irregularis DAOM 181602=DAOM 197198]